MSPQEQIACHRLQLEGLESWPEDEIKAAMRLWILQRIERLSRNIN